jgi:hypothetical protein
MTENQMRSRAFPAALRRHAGQRQSSVAAVSDIGGWYGSAAHQQPPSSAHSNAVPQRAQASWRGGLIGRCMAPPSYEIAHKKTAALSGRRLYLATSVDQVPRPHNPQ